MLLKKYIGNKKFYLLLAAIVLPIMLQNGITQFVNLLDNIMVGRLGTEQMSGVAIVNQIIFVFNLCIFGGMAGAGIFTAQFHGNRDTDGVRSTFRFKLLIAVAILAVSYLVFLTLGDVLIMSFLQDSDNSGDLKLAFECGRKYLNILMLSLPFVAMTQVYSSTLRETGKTVPPMLASLASVFVNLILNYLLIYGRLGFPALGVEGAAIATLVARILEMTALIIWSHINIAKNPFLKNAYRSMKIESTLAKQILIKGTPLLFNEFLWATGITVLAQAYSTRGITAVAAYNICSTVSNLFGVVFISMGNAIAIILGQQLGSGDTDGARDTQKKLEFVSIVASVVTGGIMAGCSGLFPLIYNTSDEVRHSATLLLIVCAAWTPLNAYTNSCYFTLRSGGQVIITFLFDSCFVWAASVPLAFVLSRFTDIDVVTLYAACLGIDIIKCIIGAIFVKSGKWAKNIVSTKK